MEGKKTSVTLSEFEAEVHRRFESALPDDLSSIPLEQIEENVHRALAASGLSRFVSLIKCKLVCTFPPIKCRLECEFEIPFPLPWPF